MSAVVSLLSLMVTNPAAATQPSDRSVVECRDDVPTGTRLRRPKICMTRQNWDRIRDESLQSTAHRKDNAERSRTCTSVPC